ncbi:MAG: lamin tail domain-containing protein [Myxococcota bacterium]
MKHALSIVCLLLSTACSEYGVSEMEQEDGSWFDKSTDRWDDDEQSSEDDFDTGDSFDTGFVESESPDEPDVPEWESEDESDEDDSDEDEYDASDDDDTDTDSSGGSSGSGSSGSGSSGSGSSGSGGSGSGGGSPSESPGSTSSSARSIYTGELVINEIMIYPRSVDDAQGEWVEFKNVSGDWLDLADYRLADRGVDDVEISPVSSGSLIVPPDAYVVICAEADFWDNGGVDCDGTIRYWTMGDGFALSNSEDEVQLLNRWGSIIDEVRYSEGFAAEGGSMGLNRDRISASDNDRASNWCEQYSSMSFGDSGTPGEENDRCW